MAFFLAKLSRVKMTSILLPKTAQLFLDLGAGLHGAGGQIAIWLKKVFFPKSPFYTKNVQ